MSGAHWLKLETGFFDDERVKLIESLQDRDTILVIWYKLLCLAGKTNDAGLVYIVKHMPMEPRILAILFGRPEDVVSRSINTLVSLGMVTVHEGAMGIDDWSRYLESDKVALAKEKDAERKRIARGKQKKAVESIEYHPSEACPRTVRGQSAECPPTEVEVEVEKEVNTASPDKPVREKVMVPKAKRELHTLTKPILDAWANLWREKYGTPYPWNAGTKARDGQAGYFSVSAAVSSFCADLEKQGVGLDQVERGMRWWLFDSYEGYQRTVQAFLRGCFTTHGCREAMGTASNTAAEESFEEFAARMNRRGKG